MLHTAIRHPLAILMTITACVGAACYADDIWRAKGWRRSERIGASLGLLLGSIIVCIAIWEAALG